MFPSTPVPEIIFVNGRDMILASDAARLAGLSAAYITRLCRNGKLAGARLTSGWFVDEILSANFSPIARQSRRLLPLHQE